MNYPATDAAALGGTAAYNGAIAGANAGIAGAGVTVSSYGPLTINAASYFYGSGGGYTGPLPGTPGNVTPTLEVEASVEGLGAKYSILGTYHISSDTVLQGLNTIYNVLNNIFGDGGSGDGGSGDGGDGGTGDGGTGDGGDGGTPSGDGPVVLDLSGKGVKITPMSQSNMFFDMANDGYQQHTAWAGAGNGVLVYDPNGGAVTEARQVEFTLWDPAARSDMQALGTCSTRTMTAR